MPVRMLPVPVPEWPEHLAPIRVSDPARVARLNTKKANLIRWGAMLRHAHWQYERKQTRRALRRSLALDTRRQDTLLQIEIGREHERCLILMAETYRDARRAADAR